MRKCVEIDKAWGYDLLCDWFISSIDDTTPPCWTPEHIEELLDGFYVIPKRKEIAATVFDAEPKALYDQIKWERDIAISQLESYGVQLGEKADVQAVRHGKWIMESDGGTRCSSCKKKVHDTTNGCYEPVDLSEMPYCPKCGAKMDGDE